MDPSTKTLPSEKTLLCFQEAQAFTDVLGEAAEASSCASSIKLPPSAMLQGVDAVRPGSFAQAAAVSEVADACNDCLVSWCTLAEAILEEAPEKQVAFCCHSSLY